jgi:hypothetical protein
MSDNIRHLLIRQILARAQADGVPVVSGPADGVTGVPGAVLTNDQLIGLAREDAKFAAHTVTRRRRRRRGSSGADT